MRPARHSWPLVVVVAPRPSSADSRTRPPACPISYAATDAEVVDKHYNGFYVSDPATPGKETALASNPEIGHNLWRLSAELIEEKLGKGALVEWAAQA